MVKRSIPWIYIPIMLLIVGGLISLGAAVYLLLGDGEEGRRTEDGSTNLNGVLKETVDPSVAATQSLDQSDTLTSIGEGQPATAVPPRETATLAPQPIYISIVEDGNQRTVDTTSSIVGDALVEAGILLSPADQLVPPAETPIEPGMIIHITRPIPLSIQVDGEIFHIQSVQRDVAAVLADLGISLGENDQVTPGLDAKLQAGDTIDIQRIAADVFFIDEEIPYQTIYQPSPELDLDSKAPLSPGTPGILRRQVRIVYEDGQEVERIVENEWVEQEAVNEVIGYGTKINLGTVETTEGTREYWRVVHMRVTAYTAASSGKPPDHPAYGITASGRPAGTGIVAIDPNVVPFRSEVFVPGYGIGYAGDTGGGVKGRWIDLGFDEDELVAWSGYVDVYYLTPVPDEINYLIPEILP